VPGRAAQPPHNSRLRLTGFPVRGREDGTLGDRTLREDTENALDSLLAEYAKVHDSRSVEMQGEPQGIGNEEASKDLKHAELENLDRVDGSGPLERAGSTPSCRQGPGDREGTGWPESVSSRSRTCSTRSEPAS